MKNIKFSTYWSPADAAKLLAETERTGLSTASLIRFHACRSLSSPIEPLTGSTNPNIRTRLNVESR